MLLYPNAKINLGLNVVEKREDGYHNIETVFYPIGLTDVLEVVPSDTCLDYSFSVSGIEIGGDPEENLIVKAYWLLKSEYYFKKTAITTRELQIRSARYLTERELFIFTKKEEKIRNIYLSYVQRSDRLVDDICFQPGTKVGDRLLRVSADFLDQLFLAVVRGQSLKHIGNASAERPRQGDLERLETAVAGGPTKPQDGRFADLDFGRHLRDRHVDEAGRAREHELGDFPLRRPQLFEIFGDAFEHDAPNRATNVENLPVG